MKASVEKFVMDVLAYLFFGLLLMILLNSCAPRVVVVQRPAPAPRKVVVVQPRPQVIMPAPPPPPVRYYPRQRHNPYRHW